MNDEEYISLIKDIKRKRFKNWQEWMGEDIYWVKHAFMVRTHYLNDIRGIIEETNLTDKEKLENIMEILEADYKSAKIYYDDKHKYSGFNYTYKRT